LAYVIVASDPGLTKIFDSNTPKLSENDSRYNALIDFDGDKMSKKPPISSQKSTQSVTTDWLARSNVCKLNPFCPDFCGSTASPNQPFCVLLLGHLN
jgi:hypothetical protein